MKYNAKILSNLVNIMTRNQNLIYKALDIKSEREHYCKKLETELSEKIGKIKPDTLEKIADLWYDGYIEALVEIYPSFKAVVFETSKKMLTREAIINCSVPKESRFVYYAVDVNMGEYASGSRA